MNNKEFAKHAATLGMTRNTRCRYPYFEEDRGSWSIELGMVDPLQVYMGLIFEAEEMDCHNVDIVLPLAETTAERINLTLAKLRARAKSLRLEADMYSEG